MRKAMVGLIVGTLVLGQAVVAVAATVKPSAPISAVAGRINNRAVLGLMAAQGAADACVPKSAEDKSCKGSQGGDDGNGGGGSGGGLPIVLVGVGVVGGIAAAAGGGGGGGGNGPSSS